MQAATVLSKMAWGEREVSNRSAKRSAAMVVATFAALLIFCDSHADRNQLPNKLPSGTRELMYNRNLEYCS
jgi:hypothetical protein